MFSERQNSSEKMDFVDDRNYRTDNTGCNLSISIAVDITAQWREYRLSASHRHHHHHHY